MKIKRLYINNYKSLVDFELVEPNPFSVFVGPNAAGKSNIFEALEFITTRSFYPKFIEIFGGRKNICNKKYPLNSLEIDILLTNSKESISIFLEPAEKKDDVFKRMKISEILNKPIATQEEVNKFHFDHLYYKEMIENFSRIFIKNSDLVKIKTNGSEKLRIDAANLENVLFRILQDEVKREEITEWLELLIPEFSKIEVHKSELSGEYYLRIFEKYMDEPIGKNLISDGTYNILALLTAVYQSDEPQFLCIEEPENGLNPYVIRELVGFFRKLCEDKGHYIWLNTHSPTLVKELQPKELILINKVNGETKAKQLDKDLKFKSMPLDEAWLTNTLGGGLPW